VCAASARWQQAMRRARARGEPVADARLQLLLRAWVAGRLICSRLQARVRSRRLSPLVVFAGMRIISRDEAVMMLRSVQCAANAAVRAGARSDEMRASAWSRDVRLMRADADAPPLLHCLHFHALSCAARAIASAALRAQSPSLLMKDAARLRQVLQRGAAALAATCACGKRRWRYSEAAARVEAMTMQDARTARFDMRGECDASAAKRCAAIWQRASHGAMQLTPPRFMRHGAARKEMRAATLRKVLSVSRYARDGRLCLSDDTYFHAMQKILRAMMRY